MNPKNETLKKALLHSFEQIRPVFGDQDYITLHNQYKRLKKDDYSKIDLPYKLSLFSKAIDKYKNL